jgi:S1-C subfamily serine protease
VTRRAGLVALAVTLAGIVGCRSGSRPNADPDASSVTIRATGCRLQPNRALGMVADDELVVTVAHAVAGEDDIAVTAPDGRTVPAVIAAIDTELDAAVLRADGLGLPSLPQRPYAEGEPSALMIPDEGNVHATPVEVRRRVTVRTSDIYRQGVHLRPGLELTATVVAGDSGGGLVGADGDLLGVVWAASRSSTDRAWATPIEAYGPLLDAARAGGAAAPVPCAR